MKFSVIIPNYNGKHWLQICLPSVIEALEKVGGEIIIADNNSTDGSREFLKKLKTQSLNLTNFNLILNSKNLGFAAAVNQGVKRAQYNWIVVMNNDLKVKNDWFVVMGRAIEKWRKKVKLGSLTGLILSWEGEKVESTGLVFKPWGRAENRDNGLPLGQLQRKEGVIWGVNAAAAVYNKKAFLGAGGFPDDFFAYLEDVALSISLNKLGYKAVFVPEAISLHFGGGTADTMRGLRWRQTLVNWFRIYWRYFNWWEKVIWLPLFLWERTKEFLGRIKKWIVIGMILGSLGILGFLGGLGIKFWQMGKEVDYLSVLILGLDKRPSEHSLLTDTIMLAVASGKTGNVLLFSLPRDLWLEDLKTKINALYFYGGAKLAKEKVEEILNWKIDYVAVVKMEDIKRLIDLLGGIEVEVKRGFVDEEYPRDDGSGGVMTVRFEPGWQIFDGERALQFMRSRKSRDPIEGTDEARQRRQKQVIAAIRRKLVSDWRLWLNWRRISNLYRFVFSQLEIYPPLPPKDAICFWRLGLKMIRGKQVNVEVPYEGKNAILQEGKDPIYKTWILYPKSGNWQELKEFFREKVMQI